MKRIALLPTGRTEWNGLPEALLRLFPGHDFYSLPTRKEVDSYPDRFPAQGFTSNPLASTHETDPPETALDLIARAAQAALGDRAVEPADAVVVIEDLELLNDHQSDRVVRVFRRAVEMHLSRLQGARAATEKALLDRVSFHLVVPMIEAWLFGDPSALTNAGLPKNSRPSLSVPDLEDFQTEDEAYLAATESDCPCWVSNGKKRKRRPKWLGNLRRARHPKGYLQWLCREGSHKDCTTYDETVGGSRALAGITWETLLARGGLHYLRALVGDIAEVLEQTPTVGYLTETDPPLTSLLRRPRSPVLRNL